MVDQNTGQLDFFAGEYMVQSSRPAIRAEVGLTTDTAVLDPMRAFNIVKGTKAALVVRVLIRSGGQPLTNNVDHLALMLPGGRYKSCKWHAPELSIGWSFMYASWIQLPDSKAGIKLLGKQIAELVLRAAFPSSQGEVVELFSAVRPKIYDLQTRTVRETPNVIV